MVPMRLGNLAGIDLEKHLIRSRGGVVHVAIPGRLVKNGVDIEAVLPPQTVRLLDAYLERYRPVLVAEGSPWLFPGKGSSHKSDQCVRNQIIDCVKRRCGLLVNPHLFRHIAAKLYLDANPGAYGLIRLVHGHKSVETTTRYYCGMETPAAMRHFDDHILKLRAQPTPLHRKARRSP
jgi:integrase